MKVTILSFLVLAACAQADEAPKPRQTKSKALPAEWVVVEATKRLSDTEDMRILRFSGRAGDTTCILYRNTELATTQIVCPQEAPDLSGYDYRQPD